MHSSAVFLNVSKTRSKHLVQSRTGKFAGWFDPGFTTVWLNHS